MLLSLLITLLSSTFAHSTACATSGLMTVASGVNTVCQNSVLGTPQGSSLGTCAGTTAGTTTYSAGTYKVCDGSNWYDMKGSSIGSCVGTTAGTLSYVSNAFQFCDGTNWYSLTSGTVTINLTSTSCDGVYCKYVSSGDADANGYCISNGYASAVSSTSGGNGCNGCYYVDWVSNAWNTPYHNCNSCNQMATVTCQSGTPSIPCGEAIYSTGVVSNYIDGTWGSINAGSCPYPSMYQFQNLGSQSTDQGVKPLVRCGYCGPGSVNNPSVTCLNNSHCVAH